MTKTKKIILIIVTILIALIIIVKGLTMYFESKLNELGNVKIADVDLSRIENGVYPGSYSCFPITAEVLVTIKAHQITKIDLVKHVTGQGKSAETIPSAVVAKQTLQIDAVAGATYSSKVILKAIEDALKNGS